MARHAALVLILIGIVLIAISFAPIGWTVQVSDGSTLTSPTPEINTYLVILGIACFVLAGVLLLWYRTSR